MVRNLQGTKGIRDKALLLIGFVDNAANQLTCRTGNNILKYITKIPSDKIIDYKVTSDTVQLESGAFTTLTTTGILNTS